MTTIPTHTSKSTHKWIQNNQINVLQWPSQSPDMNPMEHLWNELDRRIKNRSKLPTSVQNLWDIVQEEWEKIPTEFCQNLIHSMQQRVLDMKKAKGGYTRW